MHRSPICLTALALAFLTNPLQALIIPDALPEISTRFEFVNSLNIDGSPYNVLEIWADVGPDRDWTNSYLNLTLTSGSLYQHPLGSYTQPSSALIDLSPDLAYDSYIQTASNDAPMTPGSITFTDTTVNINWGDTARTGPGSYKIAQLTLSADAQGTLKARNFVGDFIEHHFQFTFDASSPLTLTDLTSGNTPPAQPKPPKTPTPPSDPVPPADSTGTPSNPRPMLSSSMLDYLMTRLNTQSNTASSILYSSVITIPSETPAISPFVPEPTSLSIIVFGGILLFTRMRNC